MSLFKISCNCGYFHVIDVFGNRPTVNFEVNRYCYRCGKDIFLKHPEWKNSFIDDENLIHFTKEI
jgi:hypothetical protein